MSIEETLASLRKERGMSQLEAAEALGVSRQAVSKWESGAALPSIDNLRAISRLYDVTIDHLVGSEDGPSRTSGPVTPGEPEPPQEPDTPNGPEPSQEPDKPRGAGRTRAAVLCLICLMAAVIAALTAAVVRKPAAPQRESAVLEFDDLTREEWSSPDDMPALDANSGGSPDPRDYFEVNELGLTYGKDVIDGVSPDLIAAIGLHGVHGYVYRTELWDAGAKKTLDDPVLDSPASIPLYASDGVTVIGEFPIGPRPDEAFAFNVTVPPHALLKNDEALSLEAGKTVRIYGSYSPFDLKLVIGLISPDGHFYNTAVSGGVFDKTILIPEDGTYFLGFSNSEDASVRTSGYIYYFYL